MVTIVIASGVGGEECDCRVEKWLNSCEKKIKLGLTTSECLIYRRKKKKEEEITF